MSGGARNRSLGFVTRVTTLPPGGRRSERGRGASPPPAAQAPAASEAAAVRAPAAAQTAGRPPAAKTASRHRLVGETDRLAGGLLRVEEGVDARGLQETPPFCFVGPRQTDGGPP